MIPDPPKFCTIRRCADEKGQSNDAAVIHMVVADGGATRVGCGSQFGRVTHGQYVLNSGLEFRRYVGACVQCWEHIRRHAIGPTWDEQFTDQIKATLLPAEKGETLGQFMARNNVRAPDLSMDRVPGEDDDL